jgi:hypothetical protein
MITPQGIKSIGANGCEFYTYPCKFEKQCDKKNRYNPAVMIKNAYGVERLCMCTHGGGVGCHIYREQIDEEMGWTMILKRKEKRSWEKDE